MPFKVKSTVARQHNKVLYIIKINTMNRNIVKPVVAGILIGAALFFIPFFVLRVAAFILIAGLIFRLFTGRRRFSGNFGNQRFAFADRIRNMSEEEYQSFKANPGATFGCNDNSNRKQDSSTNQNTQQ